MSGNCVGFGDRWKQSDNQELEQKEEEETIFGRKKEEDKVQASKQVWRQSASC